MTPRSWLFVPGDSRRKIEKALGTAADALILDLEDSVSEANKAAARSQTAKVLREAPGPRRPAVWVRINPLTSVSALKDLAAVVPAAPDGIVLPKPDSAQDLTRLHHYLAALETAAGLDVGAIRVLPISTETARSLFGLDSYAGLDPSGAGARLAGLTWGAEDLPSAVGAARNRKDGGDYTDICRLARSLCLAAAAAAGVEAIETVYPSFRDERGLRAYAEQGRDDGFTAMLAIHPDQVEPINTVFTPGEAELERARRIVAAFDANPGAGTLALDSQMIDAPHLKQARRLLSRLG